MDIYRVGFEDAKANPRRVVVYCTTEFGRKIILLMPTNPFYVGSHSGTKHEDEMLALATICARAFTKEQPSRSML